MDNKLTAKEKFELAIEAGMQAIPYIGGSLSTLYFGSKQEKRFKRIEAFYNELRTDVEAIKSIMPDLSNQNSDEFNAILEQLHEKIEEDPIEKKRIYYKKYFLNTLLNPVNGNYNERKLFLDILSQLTDVQIELIILLSTIKKPINSNSISNPYYATSLIKGSISQLKNYGLIDASLDSIIMGGPASAINENIGLSEFGSRFHNFCIK